MSVSAGNSLLGPGGAVTISSGVSNYSDSGSLSLYSPDSAAQGVSGAISLSTGRSLNGDSGDIDLVTGESVSGSGGDIRMSVGISNQGNGGDIIAAAGRTDDPNHAGGSVAFHAGIGNSSVGGRGGDLLFQGGEAKGVSNCQFTQFDCQGIVAPTSVVDAVGGAASAIYPHSTAPSRAGLNKSPRTSCKPS